MSARHGVARLPHAARQRLTAWAQSRHGAGAETRLGQRNIYIVPSGAGWFFGLTLLVLLLAAINYQLNLGYLFAFALAGSAAMSLYQTHANLRGLSLRLAQAEDAALFAASPGFVHLRAQSAGARRWGLVVSADGGTPSILDLAPGQERDVALAWTPRRAGHEPWPTLRVRSGYPLGLWTAWSVWRPKASLWVYPSPETPAPALPAPRPIPSPAAAMRREGEELDELRPYRHGDALRRVVWKRRIGEQLVVRAPGPGAAELELVLSWDALPPAMPAAARLSRLCAWVLAATRASTPFALELPHARIGAGSGAAHTRQCLRALAALAQDGGGGHTA